MNSNDEELAVSDEMYPFTNSEETKELGVLWKSRKDCLCFKVQNCVKMGITKCEILSTIARIFDPLGSSDYESKNIFATIVAIGFRLG